MVCFIDKDIGGTDFVLSLGISVRNKCATPRIIGLSLREDLTPSLPREYTQKECSRQRSMRKIFCYYLVKIHMAQNGYEVISISHHCDEIGLLSQAFGTNEDL